MKAYRSRLWDVISIVTGETASQARYGTYRAARKAGYGDVEFSDIDVVRAPAFDKLAADKPKGASLGWRDYNSGWGCLRAEFDATESGV